IGALRGRPQNRLIFWIFSWIVRKTCDQAVRFPSMSEGMRRTVACRNCEALHMLPASHALSIKLADGLPARLVDVEDRIHVDATENGLVVQVRALRPLP